MEVTYNQCDLIVAGKKKRFTHEIRKISVLENKILVLLAIPQDDKETIDNIYAVSYDGEIIWKVFQKCSAIVFRTKGDRIC